MQVQCPKCGEARAMDELFRKNTHGPYEQWNLRGCVFCTSQRKPKSKPVAPEGFHKCSKCGEIKPLESFRKKEVLGPLEWWNVRECKECIHKDYHARMDDPEQHEKLRALTRQWKKNNAKRHSEHAIEYRKRNPEKTKAQNKLNYAVRTGAITRGPCEICGTTEKVHAHHVSYEQKDWLNVNWYCFRCHAVAHKPT